MGARLAEQATYLAVEPDETSFAVAQAAITPRGGTVVNGTVDAIPAGDVFDLVCAFEVLEHLEDDDAALQQWAERVRHGGHLMLSVPAHSARFAPMDVMSGHFRRYDPGQLAAALRRLGFVDVEETLYAWPLGYLLEAVRNRLDARKLRNDRATIEEHTAASGRTLQPSRRVLGLVITIGVSPFLLLQRLRPDSGTGVVVVGRRPE